MILEVPKLRTILVVFLTIITGARLYVDMGEFSHQAKKWGEKSEEITRAYIKEVNADYDQMNLVVTLEEYPKLDLRVTSRVDDSIVPGDLAEIRGILKKTELRMGSSTVGYISYATIRVVSSGSRIKALLYKLRRVISRRLHDVFNEPSGGFAAGILLGERASLPRSILDDFRQTGLTHLLALSGFNIVILIQCIVGMLCIFPKKIATVVALIFITLFTIMVGASASIVRAAIMGSLGLIASLLGRPYMPLRMLMTAGLMMVIQYPFTLFDIGFQLSFFATLGLMTLSKKIEAGLPWLQKWDFLREGMCATWAAQIATLPIIIWHFKAFSVISPLANLLVAPAIPIAMLGAFCALLFGAIVAIPTTLLIQLILWVISVLAALPMGFIDFGNS